MKLARDPELFFDTGGFAIFWMFFGLLWLTCMMWMCLLLDQYLLADSAYKLSNTVIPAYKAPAAYIPKNSEFNHCIAKARVRNEHTIGMLKGWFSSLREMRLQLFDAHHMKHYIRWLYSCVVLHNMLGELGDQWEELDQLGSGTGNGEVSMAHEASRHSRSREALRSQVKAECRAVNYARGVLPINQSWGMCCYYSR
jgi:hypothetical protein